PLLANTQAQAASLRAALSDIGPVEVFPAMRYWHPMSDAAAAQLRDFAPDRIVLLPLYPQFSTTTTGSSARACMASAARHGITAPMHAVCCYPTQPGFIGAVAALTKPVYERAAASFTAKKPRLLFTAHGLPKKIVAKGDPYQAQVEM